jgi:ABC-type glycerol-3-phosphate transport system substrate-binding protein
VGCGSTTGSTAPGATGSQSAAGSGIPSSAPAPAYESNELRIQTSGAGWLGFTSEDATATASNALFYYYWHDIWDAKFPGLTITEDRVKGTNEGTAKTLLEIQSGNPADLIIVNNHLGQLVERGALTNLDAYFAEAGVTDADFLPAMADWAKVDGHWYALPAASYPAEYGLLFLPQTIEAAGLDPANPPKTFAELWDMTQKVTQFNANGDLERIGYDLADYWSYGKFDVPMNMYCGSWTTYDPSTQRLTANAPCHKEFFAFEKKVLDFYGGMDRYKVFRSASGSPWDCADNWYLHTGKILYMVEAWWIGQQMDACDNMPEEWRLAAAPAGDGTEGAWGSTTTTAWLIGIPTGAKSPRLAFDFAKTILWDNGATLGLTGNGATTLDQQQPWAEGVAKNSVDKRTKSGAAGQPMETALKTMLAQAAVGQVATPPSPHYITYIDLLNAAWQEIAYGRQTVDEALDGVQAEIDQVQ